MPIRLTRRTLLRLLAGGAGSVLLPAATGCRESTPAATAALRTDFATANEGPGWGEGWTTSGVANLRRESGSGVLEAGSDIFPNDPRPVAFVPDRRALDSTIQATLLESGSAAGVVLRRTSPRDYYAAVLDVDALELRILRRTGYDLVVLASAPLTPEALPDATAGRATEISLAAEGASPTRLRAAVVGAGGLPHEVEATDDVAALQQPGDPGVLAQSDTLLPDSNPVLPALGNLHLLPYSVQEGQAVIATPAGQQFIEAIRRRSTARFARIEVQSAELAGASAPAVMAATTGAPLAGGATLHVATDLPCEVTLELSRSPDFSAATTIDGSTGPFEALAQDVVGLEPGTVHWRPRLRRGGTAVIGPARSFRVLPPPGAAGRFTLAYGSCASQFNAIFDHLAAREPDLFVWQGDLNYPDTHGPFSQTIAGYAGIWRHLLDTPRLAPLLSRCAFAAGRDDHDYGLQDANAANLPPFGLAPFEALMNPRPWQRISAGLADVWLLDQRLHKSDPTLPDTADKTLLGAQQRAWLFDGIANSTAPFRVICSPCTLAPAPGANARDGSWAAGYTAERDLLLAHLAAHPSTQTVFLSGDTHFTMVWDRDGLLEQRACPLDIPLPNDQSISNPGLEASFADVEGVAYWSRQGHFSFLTFDGGTMTLELVREDGTTVHSRTFATA